MLFVTALARSCYNTLASEIDRSATIEGIGVTELDYGSAEFGYLACNPHRLFLRTK
jgi:hypothetical protein